jgi:hypothetical protein
VRLQLNWRRENERPFAMNMLSLASQLSLAFEKGVVGQVDYFQKAPLGEILCQTYRLAGLESNHRYYAEQQDCLSSLLLPVGRLVSLVQTS